MVDAKGLCSEWQSLLGHFRPVFTLGGWARFAQWITGTVLCSEEHTITQILTGLGLENQWRNVEHFAEYGSWDRETIERQLMWLVEKEHPARWGRYHPVAIDDTKEQRTSADVWETCTFHESGARGPNRATTVRAHNWVVMGDLAPGKPWTLRKRHVSILDLRRLFWKHRSRFSQVMSAVGNLKKPPQTKYPSGQPTSRAA